MSRLATLDREKRPGSPSLTVVVDGEVSPDLAEQCTALGLRVAALSDGRAETAGRCLLAGSADMDSVRRGLAPPFSGFIELGDEGLLGVGLRCFNTAREGGFCLSLSTLRAYGMSVSELLSWAMRRNMALADGEAADLIDIGIGEALGNAIIHGNLGIPNHLRTTSRGFEHFRLALSERIADPVLSRRRVEINVRACGPEFLTIAVSDQGLGFDLAGKLARSVHSEAKSGRGLGLIRRICVSMLGEDDGRTLVMTFAR